MFGFGAYMFFTCWFKVLYKVWSTVKAIIGTILSLEDIVTSFCHCVYFMKHCVLLHADFLFQEMVTGLYIVHIQIVANNDVCNLLLANNDVCMYVCTRIKLHQDPNRIVKLLVTSLLRSMSRLLCYSISCRAVVCPCPCYFPSHWCWI